MMRMLLLTGLVALAGGCATSGSVASTGIHDHGAAAPVAAGAGTLTLIGPAGQAESLSQAALAALPHVDVAAVMHGATHRFSGVLLGDLLAWVGAPTGAALRGAELSHVVIASARDGYRVALSLAETDASIRSTRVIVADAMDGSAIPAADGPFRLVVEGDLKPARSARLLERIEVRKLE